MQLSQYFYTNFVTCTQTILHELQEMGRPSIERKREQRKRKKLRRKTSKSHLHISEYLSSDSNPTSHNTMDSPNVDVPTSPLLFSDPPVIVDNDSRVVRPTNPPTPSTPISNTLSSHPINDDETSTPSHICTCKDATCTIGNVDTDLIEMNLYDIYRRDDGEPYSTEYLLKCTAKLRKKVEQDRLKLSELQALNMKITLENKEERERIRKFYETIAFGRSRTGLLVRTAMGTSTAAGKIFKELKALYSVEQDSNYY